jgi:transcriptional regulator with XRE-family HTH domain
MDRQAASKVLGSLLRNARTKKGLTQKEAAEIAGCSHTDYCRYETGRTLPELERIYDLCKALKLNPGKVLLTLAENENRVTSSK